MALVVATGLAIAACSTMGSDRAGDRKPHAGRVELNTASRHDLAELPGLTKTDADRIIAARPYKSRRGLLYNKVLTEQQFDAVKDAVYVEHEAD